MRRENINYFVVGCFVLALGGGFVYVMLRLAGSAAPADQYHIHYRNVAGLKFGTPVYYEGYQVGQVEKIQPDHSQDHIRYLITVSIIKGWPIPEDSVARILSSGLLSAKSIDIHEGQSRQRLLAGGEIPGQPAINVMDSLSSAADSFRELAHNIQPLVKSLESQFTNLVDQLTGVTNGSVRPLLNSIQKRVESPETFAKLDHLLEQLNQSAASLQVLLGKENQHHVTNFLAGMSDVAGNLNGLVSRIEETRVQMNQVLRQLDGLARDNRPALKASIRSLHRSLEVVSQHIDAITHNLEGSMRNMNEFSRELRENPGLLIRGSAQPDEGQRQ